MRRKSTGRFVLRNIQRRAGRRQILDGFPVTPRNLSLEEITAYFSGDVIQCLLCGKKYKSLGVHIKSIHELSQDEYKEMYGLFWRRGLTSKDCHEAISDIVSKRIEENGPPIHRITLEEQRKKHRPMTSAHREMILTHLPNGVVSVKETS
jgi:hypothetical protein